MHFDQFIGNGRDKIIGRTRQKSDIGVYLAGEQEKEEEEGDRRHYSS